MFELSFMDKKEEEFVQLILKVAFFLNKDVFVHTLKVPCGYFLYFLLFLRLVFLTLRPR